METIIPVGADVHKDTNSECLFDFKEGAFFAEAVIEPGVENMIKYIEKIKEGIWAWQGLPLPHRL